MTCRSCKQPFDASGDYARDGAFPDRCWSCAQSFRVEVANAANEAGTLSRLPGAPKIAHDSPREVLLAWLAWNDPNGTYLDDECAAEGWEPTTLETAWELIMQALEG